ncbi:MAG: phosphoribosylanthranilate isomerase [Nitrospirae bacterium]|nr:phosphoribosylanthranilate isomerase [Nitrospirota bacterium]
MEVRVKICGITNLDDALAAIDFGADALGFVFFEKSPRWISYKDAELIIKNLPPFITTIGVFVNQSSEQIKKIVSNVKIDALQIYEQEITKLSAFSRQIIKVIRIKSLQSLEPLINFKDNVSAFLLDAYSPNSLGGTGKIFNWDIAVEAKKFGRIILAGGLTPENISEAVKHVRPYGVDVSGGVEAEKGKKDLKKLKLFIERAKAA